jgi:hypothetical protein
VSQTSRSNLHPAAADAPRTAALRRCAKYYRLDNFYQPTQPQTQAAEQVDFLQVQQRLNL